jgi:hypothetical protein
MNPDATDGSAHGHWREVKAWVLAAAVAGAPILLGPRMAHATDGESIHFHYAAPPGCPAEQELLAITSDMGGAFHLAAPGEPARTLGVAIEKTERGFSGSLSVRSVTGEERVRTVRCSRCESAVRALGLIMAMALEDAQPAPPVEETSPPAPEPPPVEPPGPPAYVPPPDSRDESGGIAATVLWGSFGWTPTGAGAMAVAPGATRLGGVLAVTTVNVDDPRYQISPTYALASGHGSSARLGGVAAWGAPWARDEWAGFMAEGGVRGGVVNGAVWPLTASGESCSSTNGSVYNCTSGPGTPRTWRFVSPYLAGTVVVQVAPRLPVRPFLALTLLWSGDYRGNSTASLTLDAGIAWRSW